MAFNNKSNFLVIIPMSWIRKLKSSPNIMTSFLKKKNTRNRDIELFGSKAGIGILSVSI